MIGGEFEIDMSQFGTFRPAPDTYYYASGRAALYQILKHIVTFRRKVFFPDYLCHTIVDTAIKTGYDYIFYALTPDLKVTISALDEVGFKNGDAVLLINYFGLLNLQPDSSEIKAHFPDSIVIEDDVQAPYCFLEEDNPFADYRFASLRKGFPVPDGGLVYTKKVMDVPTNTNTFAAYKIRGGALKLKRGQNGIKDEDYLMLFDKGESLIDQNYDSEMSQESRRLFSGIDFSFIKKRRKDNARFLLNGLRILGINPIIPVSDVSVPLFVPVYLSNRDEIRKRMFAKEVFCPVHWPLPENVKIKNGKKMMEHELSLIVDQRYDQDDMAKILDIISK